MSSVTITIGGDTVSNDTVDVDIWMNRKTCVGASALKIDNTADQWGDDFDPNEDVNISINGVLMFVGKVDDVIPYLDKKGVKTNNIKVKSRDAGRYLIDNYHTEDHGYARSGAIIDDILAGVGDPLLYTDPGGTPYVTYNSKRTKLVDSFKDIPDLAGYDRYIDTNGRLQYFAAGTVASGVALKSVAGAADNNLLDFEEYEEIGNDIKNYIEVHAGSVKDHWTNGNAADWTDLLGGGTTFADESTVNIYGATSIKVTASDNDETFGLDFSGGLYSQGTSVDMSAFAQNKVLFRHDDASVGSFSLLPYLKDGSGNEIIFTRNQSGAGSKGYTNDLETLVDQWRTLSYQTGEHTDNVVLATATSGRWSGDTGFDWSDVEDIGFRLLTTDDMSVIYITGWYMPAIEVKSIAQNAASIAAYGKRMYSEYAKRLTSQNELDAESAKILAFKKDPIRKFKATATGQTGTKYAGQTLTVQAPDYGLAGATTYVIQSIHHILHNDTNTRGWDFITKYELALSDVDSTRVLSDDNPTEALLLKIAKENRGFKGSQTDDEYYLGEIVTGITPQLTSGAVQPTDANEGDRFYDSTNNKEYEYTGGAWVLLELDATVVTGEIDPDQLAIELRGWTSDLNFIWDEANLDWNEIWWGQQGNEDTTDATIAYNDASSVGVNNGHVAALADGTYYFYWDENFITGAKYDLQRSTTYSDSTGAGKGLVAIVLINDADDEAPSFLIQNSYVPTIGAGAITTHAIFSKHISADFITGKNFQSAAGATSVTFTSTGIIGKNAGVTQFSLSSADGKATAAAGNVVIDVNGIFVKGNYMEFEDAGSANDAVIWMNGTTFSIDSSEAILCQGVGEAILQSTTGDVTLDADVDVNILAGAAHDVIITGTTLDVDVTNVDFDASTKIELTAASGVGDGIKLLAGTSYVQVDYGDTDVRIYGTDDVVITAGDDLNLAPTGDILVNGNVTLSDTKGWTDGDGNTHSVVISKGLIRTWSIT